MHRITRFATGLLYSAIASLVMRTKAPPRLIQFSEHPFVNKGHAKTLYGGRMDNAARAFVAALTLACARLFRPALVAAMLVLILLVGAGGVAGLSLALAPAVLTTKQTDLDRITKEMEELSTKYAGKKWETKDRERYEALGAEGVAIQAELKDHVIEHGLAATKSDLRRFLDGIDDPTLPDDNDNGKKSPKSIAGFISLGEAVTNSEGLKAFIAAGMPKQYMTLYVAPEGKGLESPNGRKVFVALNREERAAWEAKAVPTIGSGVIEPDRIAEIVRTTEHDQLMLRDVMNVSQTSAASVTYIRINSVTRAAAAVAAGSAKPEATMSTEVVTQTVRTQAVWMPVHNNQLADLPQLRNMIDVELLYDLAKYEEEQMFYGLGTGEEFEGIITNSSVVAARTVTGDTLIDIIRRAVTDVRRDGYSPNAVAIDPLDWEEVELEKGTDNRYVWAVIRDVLGARIWSLRVVETVGAEANEGNPTEERNLIVGDWIRGATLWVRETPSVAVGWINDQFTKNQRTLLAEQRAAFGVKRPKAFRKHQTQAAVT